MKKVLSIVVLILIPLSMSFAVAASSVQGLIDKYGKENIKNLIINTGPDSQITIQVGDKLMLQYGRPSADFITTKSIARDLQRLGLSIEEADSKIAETSKESAAKRSQALSNPKKFHPPRKQTTVRYKQKTTQSNQSTNHSVQNIESKIKNIAVSSYPDDVKMQRYVYNKQAKAYNYLQRVRDSEIKRIAISKYPNDFAMQKHVYQKQLSAKNYMKSVKDAELLGIAKRQYPQDYAMQQYVYNKQAAAKHYMSTATNQTAQFKAMRRYPRDYSMQKYIYDKLVY